MGSVSCQRASLSSLSIRRHSILECHVVGRCEVRSWSHCQGVCVCLLVCYCVGGDVRCQNWISKGALCVPDLKKNLKKTPQVTVCLDHALKPASNMTQGQSLSYPIALYFSLSLSFSPSITAV